MNSKLLNSQLFESYPEYISVFFEGFRYPWEVIAKIKENISKLVCEEPEEFEFLTAGVLVGKNVTISPNAVIEPPALIGHNTQIRPGAYIRGNVVCGSDCVIGNSSELKNCVLLDNVQIPHYNYVGDSILGNHSHMGAGSICSNLKSDGKSVVVHSHEDINTGMRKLGAVLGDGADIGCGCVLNPGTVVGKNTSVYPLTPLRGVYPDNSIVKSQSLTVRKTSR